MSDRGEHIHTFMFAFVCRDSRIVWMFLQYAASDKRETTKRMFEKMFSDFDERF